MSIAKAAITILIMSALARAQTLAPVRLTVPPGVETPVPIRTLPSAACTLRPEGSSDPSAGLKIYSDEAGMIRFLAKPVSRSNLNARLEVRCQAGTRSVVVPLELRADTEPTLSRPAPVDLDPVSRSGVSFVRPALRGDPMLYTAEELLNGGYPPRPDPEANPDAYASWLQAVSQPATFVAPQLATSDRVHGPVRPQVIQNGPAASGKWSGFVATGNPGFYSEVTGDWIVPAITPEFVPGSTTTTFSSMWIGIDGSASNVVVQDGTRHDSLTFGGNWSLTNFYAWTEYFPGPEHQITNFQVSPGHLIYSVVNGGPVAGNFYLHNISTGQFTVVMENAPPVGTFLGNSAEWIVERPTFCTAFVGDQCIGPILPDLSNYGTAVMFNAYAGLAGVGKFGLLAPYSNLPIFADSMFNGPNLLSSVKSTGKSSMQFTWSAFH